MVKAGPGLAKRRALFPAGRGLGVGRKKRKEKIEREERRKKKAKVVLKPSAPNTPGGNTLNE